MATTTRNFLKGRMNKGLDKRLVPDGEYTDALNIRLGSTSQSDIGSVENSEGNTKLVDLIFNNIPLGSNARCIGAFEDGAEETIYWFVHQPSGFTPSATDKIDIIVSYNTISGTTTYHLVSCDDGGGVNTTLNFSENHLINGVDLVDDLLFFTDNFNPPRRINIKKSYPQPTAYVDDPITYDDILVIKAPPIESPNVVSSEVGGEENFLEERFICFAYRYRYAENEYSATSAWSAPAFVPKPFDLSAASFLNEGMVNRDNTCDITFNSGDSLVVGVDLLFKEIANNIIRVIEKFDKSEQGYVDNTNYNYSFTNSKIYTVLPSDEIVRTFDNVPLLAKAQTMMGNRLMYGNYVEGFNLVDRAALPVQIGYQASEIKEDIGLQNLSTSLSSGSYTYTPSGTPLIVSNSVLNLDLSSVQTELTAGVALEFSLLFNHQQFENDGMTSVPTEQTVGVIVSWSYILPQAFSSVTDLFNSESFQNAVGTDSNIETSPTGYCNGTTFTDVFNCALRNQLTGGNPTPVFEYESGVTSANTSIVTLHTAGSSSIGFQFPAMRYVNSTVTPVFNVYEYYEITVQELFYQTVSNTSSLHSNRGYEIGIVYMDKFSRATTALTSNNNTAFFSCGDSVTKNSIRVTIPTTQVAPSFATRYRFVIKPDAQGYDTIYSSMYFYDPVTAHNYFLVEGENAAKSQEGTRLIVKKDSDGPLRNCIYATVLEKTVEQKNFILSDNEDFLVPGGTYLKIKVTGFNASLTADSFIAPGTFSSVSGFDGFSPLVQYTGLSGTANSSGVFTPPSIPAGSIIKLTMEFTRLGRGDGEKPTCGRRTYDYNKQFTSQFDYDDIIDWFEGDAIAATLNDGTSYVGGGAAPNNVVMVNPVTNTSNNNYGLNTYIFNYQYAVRWFRDTGTGSGNTNEIRFLAVGTEACGNSNKKESKAKVTWEIVRGGNVVAFETEPLDALPDVFYESSESYSIDALGNHSGNVTNQDIANDISGVVDTAFFNCFSFGNGIESYRVRDSAAGRTLALGNRVTSVSAQDYKRAHRSSDITYSGIYNNESNVNSLNEFNLGLANFKALEESFGPIEVLFGRETDILVLQEDKISYVLTGKNLLSDSTGGGSIASIPEVLGTQIARVEEYGISNNPESFVKYGPDSFFTDAKRGAVINLRGNGPQEQLTVLSEQGMRSWFRDMFITNFNTQKLGGFDPYMNEYVLANNTTLLPVEASCSPCGFNSNFVISPTSPANFCVDLNRAAGDVTVSFFLPTPIGTSSIEFDVDGTTYGPYTASGSFSFPSGVTNTRAVIGITGTGASVDLNLTVSCPAPNDLTLVLATVTDANDTLQTIHNQYSFVEGGVYQSPVQEFPVTFTYVGGVLGGGVVSDYQLITAPQGTGAIPTNGSVVTLGSNKTSTDTFVFNTTSGTNKFYYLASDTLFDENQIASVILNGTTFPATQTTVQPITGSFTAPANLGDFTYLYLVWDYRTPVETSLCYSTISAGDACCSCVCANGSSILVSNIGLGQITFRYTACDRSSQFVSLASQGSITVCADASSVQLTAGNAADMLQSVIGCDCC